MSFQENSHAHKKVGNRLNDGIKKKETDVVDRFLSILWRREVDLKFTTR